MVIEREDAISLMLVYPKPLVLKRKRAVSKIREKVFRFMAPFWLPFGNFVKKEGLQPIVAPFQAEVG